MTIPDGHELIYDWNLQGEVPKPPSKSIELNDETLRDGIQSPSITDPKIEQKIQILHLMEELGIRGVNLGLPGAGERQRSDVLALAREIANCKLKIKPNCAARTLKQDIDPVIEVSQKVGIPIEVATFIGSSPIRQYTEGWTLDKLLKLTEEAVTYVVEHNLPVMYVTEDTTRSLPDAVRQLYSTAIGCGARRICVCDTVGHATPHGVGQLISYVVQVVKETHQADVQIDWHGHRDRGFSVNNAIAALTAGADRIHATALGIGERVGNAAMDIIIMNLRLLGWIDNDLSKLAEYCHLVSRACRVPIPPSYPVVGKDAFRTGTGVHAAAVIKAERKGHAWLADRVYSGVPAGMFGMEQIIEIGPMSGESNVIYWLERRGYKPKPELVQKIFDTAKKSDHTLTDLEIYEIIEAYESGK
ncbi:MAG: LeuA family protein [Candidatus Zixiibacteriota bacterium]